MNLRSGTRSMNREQFDNRRESKHWARADDEREKTPEQEPKKIDITTKDNITLERTTPIGKARLKPK